MEAPLRDSRCSAAAKVLNGGADLSEFCSSFDHVLRLPSATKEAMSGACKGVTGRILSRFSGLFGERLGGGMR
jgi:hypothetical protein